MLDAIRITGNASKACSMAKIARPTWYRWMNGDPDLTAAHKAAMAAGREHRADRAEDKLGERIEKGDTTAIIFALKTLRKDIYGDKWQGELTGPGGAPLVITFAERPDGPQ